MERHFDRCTFLAAHQYWIAENERGCVRRCISDLSVQIEQPYPDHSDPQRDCSLSADLIASAMALVPRAQRKATLVCKPKR